MAHGPGAGAPEEPRRPPLGGLVDFGFTGFATPAVIRLLYVVGVVVIALGYAGIVLLAFTRGFGLGIAGLVGGAAVALLHLLLWRVLLEFLLAVVRIAENRPHR